MIYGETETERPTMKDPGQSTELKSN